MRAIRYIILHCSASEWGDAQEIDLWHKERGWKGIGYHYVVLNGYPTYAEWKGKARHMDCIGALEKGRDDEDVGAHVKGMNSESLGICLIGIHSFDKKQRRGARDLTLRLMNKYDVPIENILGHYETPTGAKQGKTCPNFDMILFRRRLKRRIFADKILRPRWFFGPL